MTEPIRSMIHAGYLIGRLCLAWVTCTGLFTKVVMAQEPQLNGIGVEIAARSGLLTAPSDVMVSKSAAEPLLNVTQAGLLTNWHIGPVETTASLSLASAFAFGARGTLPIGLLHISVRHGAFTLMLGLEQSVGVAANLRAQASHDTSS